MQSQMDSACMGWYWFIFHTQHSVWVLQGCETVIPENLNLSLTRLFQWLHSKWKHMDKGFQRIQKDRMVWIVLLFHVHLFPSSLFSLFQNVFNDVITKLIIYHYLYTTKKKHYAVVFFTIIVCIYILNLYFIIKQKSEWFYKRFVYYTIYSNLAFDAHTLLFR